MDTNYIKQAIELDIEKLGCKVWGLELFGRHTNRTLRIYIDNEQGISLEDCERVSKHVSKVLDVENDFSENYSLEVSSPGLDRKFFYSDQYKDFVGENIKITFSIDGNKKTIKGSLKAVTEEGVKIVLNDSIEEICFSSIIQANLLI